MLDFENNFKIGTEIAISTGVATGIGTGDISFQDMLHGATKSMSTKFPTLSEKQIKKKRWGVEMSKSSKQEKKESKKHRYKYWLYDFIAQFATIVIGIVYLGTEYTPVLLLIIVPFLYAIYRVLSTFYKM